MDERTASATWTSIGAAAMVALGCADVVVGRRINFSGAFVIGPLLAATAATPAVVAVVAVAALGASGAFSVYDHQGLGPSLVRLTVVLVGSGAAIATARHRRLRDRQLVRVSRVAEVAQRTILSPIPDRLRPAAFAGRYLSAQEDAAVGGDCYEVVGYKDRVRFIVADVRGKGLDAVRLAAIVLGAFREAAHTRDRVSEVVNQLDDRLAEHLGDEDFVTAVLGELGTDGRLAVVNCGHHPPLIVRRRTGIEPARNRPTRPFGLDPTPVEAVAALRRGDRLVAFTDGLIERRGRNGADLDPVMVVAACRGAPTVAAAADAILAASTAEQGAGYVDDLALLVVEYLGTTDA